MEQLDAHTAIAVLQSKFSDLLDKFDQSVGHQDKMWGRIDEIITGLATLKAKFDNSEIHKINDLETRVVVLETSKKSTWNLIGPVIYLLIGAVITKFIS